MCTVCGCGGGEIRVDGHGQNDGHHHQHDHHRDPASQADQNAGPVPTWAHATGMSQARMVEIEQDILSKNDQYAGANRRYFAERGILALNLVSSPGSGKTALLSLTLQELNGRFPAAVIEGDQQTSQDAERIRETGVKAIQINTGKGCHLDAHMVGHAVPKLELADCGVLFIENVGNLVCPAAFDLGEAHKVAILSVTEGEDKPIKYPDMFAAADLVLINKIDLLPYVDFDVIRCVEYALRVNPGVEVLRLSARSGEGVDAWVGWIEARRRSVINAQVAVLGQRLAELKSTV